MTVWATEQEDMKKLAKWQPIERPGPQEVTHPAQHQSDRLQESGWPVQHQCDHLSEAGQPTQDQSDHSTPSEQPSQTQDLQGNAHAPSAALTSMNRDLQQAQATAGVQQPPVLLELDMAEQNASEQNALGNNASDKSASKQDASKQQAADTSQAQHLQQQPAKASNDYFVPWHLPFHRAEAAMQVLKAGQQDSAATAAAGSIRIDNKKNSVVFSRYYHVYEQYELDQLVLQVPGAQVLDSFYDKDNWCVVMGKASSCS